MENTGACTHHLHIALPNHLVRPGVVLVFEVTLKRNGNNFHIIMRMFSKTHSWRYGIIIEHAKDTKMHSCRFVIICETETVPAIQPAMVSMTACVCFM